MIHPRKTSSLLVAVLATACAEPAEEIEMESEPVETETAAGPASWSYEGATGPERWGELSGDYAACSTGREQSPIDIPVEPASADLADLEVGWGQVDLTFEDTGYGMTGTPAGSPTVMLGEDRLTLLQFHPHAPSEHTIGGASYPAELHFVHQRPDGGLAVIGVLFEEGQTNPAYEPVIQALEEGQASGVALAELLPGETDYATYRGSLTTPPCTEDVRWIVMQEPVELKADQIEALAGGYGPTNRPVQPLNEREVRSEM